MPVDIEREINRAAILGTRLEHLVYNKAKEGKLISIGKNDDLLMGYWSLVFDYGKGVGCLLHHKFYGPAWLTGLRYPRWYNAVNARRLLAPSRHSVSQEPRSEQSLAG